MCSLHFLMLTLENNAGHLKNFEHCFTKSAYQNVYDKANYEIYL